MIAFRIPQRLTNAVFLFLVMHIAARRPPDLIVGADDPAGAYLRRWYVTPWRGWFESIPESERTWWQRAIKAVTKHTLPNLYLHHFLRDDDDRALHDHPSFAVSWLLRGNYYEHTIAAGGVHTRTRYDSGCVRFMPTRHAHRIELPKVPGMPVATPEHREKCGHLLIVPDLLPQACWTLFLFGPTVRNWGFHCPKGWVPWQEFTRADNPGEVGRGCE